MNFCPLIYFLPDGAEYPAHARDAAFRPAVKAATAGPDGKIGRLMTPCAGEFDLSYDPENQEWLEMDGIFIGVDSRAKATPEMLARQTARRGHLVKLGDSNDWKIPVARLCGGSSALPSRRVIKGGRRAWAVEKEYRELSDFAERVWNMNAGVKVEISDDEIDVFCGKLLNMNYRLGVTEAVLLGLFTDSAQKGMIAAMIDWPTVEAIGEELKKKQSPPAS